MTNSLNPRYSDIELVPIFQLCVDLVSVDVVWRTGRLVRVFCHPSQYPRMGTDSVPRSEFTVQKKEVDTDLDGSKLTTSSVSMRVALDKAT